MLIKDSSDHFRKYCVEGILANKKKIAEYVANSLMLVTALNPIIGYDKAAKIAKYAYEHSTSLKEACIKLKFLSAKEFDRSVDPKKMIG